MALKDLEPEGFNDTMRHYAHMTRPARMYVQGFVLGECGVWLGVDGVQTIIGYGDPAFTQGPQRISVEGTALVVDEITVSRCAKIRAVIRVLDGSLSLVAGDGGQLHFPVAPGKKE